MAYTRKQGLGSLGVLTCPYFNVSRYKSPLQLLLLTKKSIIVPQTNVNKKVSSAPLNYCRTLDIISWKIIVVSRYFRYQINIVDYRTCLRIIIIIRAPRKILFDYHSMVIALTHDHRLL